MLGNVWLFVSFDISANSRFVFHFFIQISRWKSPVHSCVRSPAGRPCPPRQAGPGGCEWGGRWGRGPKTIPPLSRLHATAAPELGTVAAPSEEAGGPGGQDGVGRRRGSVTGPAEDEANRPAAGETQPQEASPDLWPKRAGPAHPTVPARVKRMWETREKWETRTRAANVTPHTHTQYTDIRTQSVSLQADSQSCLLQDKLASAFVVCSSFYLSENKFTWQYPLQSKISKQLRRKWTAWLWRENWPVISRGPWVILGNNQAFIIITLNVWNSVV